MLLRSEFGNVKRVSKLSVLILELSEHSKEIKGFSPLDDTIDQIALSARASTENARFSSNVFVVVAI